MNRLDLVAEARSFAKDKHGAQKDKNGDPYFNHLVAVSLGVRTLGGSLEQIAAAYLHDVVEDVTAVTYSTLLDCGFPPEVVRIVWAVTKKPLEHQEDYLARVIAAGEGAMRVKVADLLHNLRPDRLASLPKFTQERLAQKYKPSLARLLQELGYLQTETEQEKLATVPIGSSYSYSASTGGAGYASYDAAHKDPGLTVLQSSKYYAPKALMVGDWPAQASSAIAKVLDTTKLLYQLEDGSEWSSSLPRVRVWPVANYAARKKYEADKGNFKWSPFLESLTGVVLPPKTKVTTSVKELTSGSDKKTK